MVRVPRDVQELSAAWSRARERVTRDLGRPPTVAELAQAAGAGVEQVLEALSAAGAYRTLSLDEPRGRRRGRDSSSSGVTTRASSASSSASCCAAASRRSRRASARSCGCASSRA